ncbi:lanthionine synthetase C family protein [Streptomyces sp. HUAS MG91]|uniref:Lanthionine synthetase C family protein n=1 Tax=Streptomyces tabacisoli TaxID=3156398 RepID=A0AAU8J3F6_9ACTN
MTRPPGLVLTVAERLADPATVPRLTITQHRQHLAYGPPGIALLHIELAVAEEGPWQHAHAWLTAATHGPVTSGRDSHPFYGAPALAHAVATAAPHMPSYRRTRDLLDRQITADVLARIARAQCRLDEGTPPALAEFDAIRGLTGYGTYLIHHQPDSVATQAVLDYCARLTDTLHADGDALPGWWAPAGPSGKPDDRFPDGHANNGVAHGIGGTLALLALAAQRGLTTDHHHQAIRAVLAWLDRWEQESLGGTLWPYWITREELRAGRAQPSAMRRPSWCYGTAGLARAQQLAALALGDRARQDAAEHALLAACTDPAQLAPLTDSGLCHGRSGLAHIAARAATDAPALTAKRLRAVIPDLVATVTVPDEPGFLDGAAGIALAVWSGLQQPHTAWDACVLTS